MSAIARARTRIHVGHAVSGLVLGYGLSRMGFTSFDEVNAMFTLSDLRLFWTFCGAFALCLIAVNVFFRRLPLAPRPLHKGVVPGALLFGLGWALCGVCPGVVLVQLGEGKAYALVTLLGILSGTWIYGHVHARYFRWDVGACEAP